MSPLFVPTSQYAKRNLEGWTIRINQHLLSDRGDIGTPAIDLLSQKLKFIGEVVPAVARQQLQEVSIWLGVNDGHAPCAEYHPSKEWLEANGYNPDKAKCVEIGNAGLFVEWSREQPMLVLHELAHAYQHQVIGWENPQIKAAHQRALVSHRYDSVGYYDGTKKRAYGLTDEHEFFAESSESYFGRNDFYPFTRSELQEHDPDTYRLVEELWGVQ
jgi:hypothetical protein